MNTSLISPQFNSLVKCIGVAALGYFSGAAGIVQAAPTSVGSFTSSGDGTGGFWGTLETITVGSTTYSSLISGTISDASTSDRLAINTSYATDAAASIGGNNLDTGALNSPFTVQFGQTVTTSDLFYFFETNSATGTNFNGSSDITIQAIDVNGAAVGSTFDIDDISINYGATIAGRTWNRQSGASALTDRQTNGVAWSLADLSLSGATNVTGFILSTENADSVAVGLAIIPEPGTFALIAGSLALLSVAMRRR